MNVGIVGIGFMGMIHYLAWKQVKGARVTAISTRDPKKLAGDWRGIQGNFGPPGTQMDLAGIARYADWRELLADRKVDLVDVCLPPDLHPALAEAALKAGKHVLVEKPIALDAAAGRRMVQAARKARRQLLIAHVLPFFPEYHFARSAILGGKYGKLLGGHLKRIIADPAWIKDFYDPRKVGGPVVDLHIHDAHFLRLVAGMPEAVFSTGRMRGDVVEFIQTQFVYPSGGPALVASGGVIRQQARSFSHGFELHLERATLMYDFAVVGGEATASTPLTVLTADGKAQRPKLSATDAFAAELTEAARAVRSGKPSELLDGGLALDALELCERETRSVRTGKLVRL